MIYRRRSILCDQRYMGDKTRLLNIVLVLLLDSSLAASGMTCRSLFPYDTSMSIEMIVNTDLPS